MAKKAFITGVNGQDGSYLAELLLLKGYEVYGFIRKVALEDEQHKMNRLIHIKNEIHLIPGSLENYPSIYNAIKNICPDEVYHLAAQSYVSYSFDDEYSTLNTNINGTYFILAACKDLAPQARIYFAASSEMFGNAKQTPQNESTPFCPRSIYGISKVAGFDLTRNYREVYNLHACSGIMFNHESPRRGFEFVTRKITSYTARIKLGLENRIKLGNIEAKRDWGHAKEYVNAMWLMLQQDEPDDYVVASGETHSVKEFLELAFNHVDLDYRDYLEIDERLYRPAEIIQLQGDAARARNHLGWSPKISFQELVIEMVDNDIALLTKR